MLFAREESLVRCDVNTFILETGLDGYVYVSADRYREAVNNVTIAIFSENFTLVDALLTPWVIILWLWPSPVSKTYPIEQFAIR